MLDPLTTDHARAHAALFGTALFRHRNNRKTVEVRFARTPFPEAEVEFAIVVCPFTGAQFEFRDGVVLGPVLPQAPYSLLCHPLAAVARAESKRQLDEHDQNCNTCVYLERVPFDRRHATMSALQPGRCRHSAPEPMYPQGGADILFAPEDYMGQRCHVPRWGFVAADDDMTRNAS